MHLRLFLLLPAAGAMLLKANAMLHRPEHWIRAWFQCFRPPEHWIGAQEHCIQLAFHCFRPRKHWIETALSHMQTDSCWNEGYAHSGCNVKLVISGRTLKRT